MNGDEKTEKEEVRKIVEKKPNFSARFFKRASEKISFFFKNAPKICIVFYIVTLIALILHIAACCSESFADFLIKYPCAAIRFINAKLTGWIPFSFAEMIIILIPLIFISLVAVGIVVSRKGTDRQYVRMLASILAAISFLYSSFVLTLAPGYKGSTLDEKLGLTDDKVTAEELYSTASYLTDRINELVDKINFDPDGFSVMPYNLDEMNTKLNDAYAKAAKKYGFISPLKSNLKYVILSDAMSYTHITGVYTYFTGEANINVAFPDYTIPYTAAHELAHQRGTARENEANFVAFLACIESDDDYILYSAYMNMLEYVLSALHSASSILYSSVWSKFDNRMIGEFNAYASFYEKYQSSTVSKISSTINNTYLQTQGVKEGSKSYGLVVDLMVAYHKSISE